MSAAGIDFDRKLKYINQWGFTNIYWKNEGADWPRAYSIAKRLDDKYGRISVYDRSDATTEGHLYADITN